ncbi:helix-turn-helix domain-containing protein [Paracoccus yeei]|uniref:Helix-turn-helix domain-containing protein n=1 Tax=Paracoccus yeei TaxID=147645 RepID=A0A1V0GRZ9_9RHOB|nr:helix-turn-helix domain-containing protein [Paracoccus yeei]
MSVYCSSLAWRHGPADRNDLLVLLAIADFADDDGYCWPSIKSLAKKARMTERGVQKIVRRLEAQGLVSILTGTGRRNCNEYTLNLDLLQKGERETLNHVHPEQGSSRTRKHKPRTSEQEKVNGGSPEPSRTITNHQDDDDVAAACEFSDTAFEVPFDFEDERTQYLAIPLSDYRSRILEAIGIEPGTSSALGGPADMAEARRWLTLPHVTEDRVCDKIRAVMMRKGARRPHSLAYFTEEMRRMSVDLEEAMKPLLPAESRQAYAYRERAAPPPKVPPVVDLDALAERWVEPVKAGRAYAGPSIKPAVARHMLDRGLVTETELRRVGVAL